MRKNLADRYGNATGVHSGRDSWAQVFETAKLNRPAAANDLVPYWLFEGPASIERHVPMLPLSSEINRLEDLRRSLAVYRMAFGQSRQEHLVALLLERFDEEDLSELTERLAIDLRPTVQLVLI